MAQKTAAGRESGRDHHQARSRARLEAARRFSIEAARLCADSRCRNVRVLEVAGLSPVCDYFVLATAASARQMKAISRDVAELGREHDLLSISGRHRDESNQRWVAIDLVDVIVHLFNEEARLFYDLDNLWGDALEVAWTRESAAEAQ